MTKGKATHAALPLHKQHVLASSLRGQDPAVATQHCSLHIEVSTWNSLKAGLLPTIQHLVTNMYGGHAWGGT